MWHQILFGLILVSPLQHQSTAAEGKVLENCKCGMANVGGRIVNGRNTPPHAYPWMAAVYLPGAHVVTCGGAVISTRNILSAGHCFHELLRLYSYQIHRCHWVVGMHNQFLQDGVRLTIRRIKLHPNFKDFDGYNDYDFSITETNELIHFNNYVRPICLPTAGEDKYIVGKYGIVAGWGWLSENDGKIRNAELQSTRLKIRPDSECSDVYAEEINYNVESMFCAFANKTDSCRGDSGGPFFLESSPNHFVTYGVISFGIGCADEEVGGVNARLATNLTLSWISDFIEMSHADVCVDIGKLRVD